MPPVRVRHTRSKGGCDSCRKQKKKCDEVRPVCGRCALVCRDCVYPHRSSSAPSTHLSSPPVAVESAEDWNAGDDFLQAIFDLSPAPNPFVSLAVPVDCDPALWASFVDASLWTHLPPDTDDEALYMHYVDNLPNEVVMQGGPARQFYAECAARTRTDEGQALKYAVLCLSAQHRANKSKVNGEEVSEQAATSIQHRSKALHHLRVAAARESLTRSDSLAAAMVLLVLATALRGESAILPTFLSRLGNLINRCDPLDTTFVPTIASLHLMYSLCHALSLQTQVDSASISPGMSNPMWEKRSDEVIETILGMKRSMLELLIRANNMTLEYRTILNASQRDEADDELAMMIVDSQSVCSTLEDELSNDAMWEKYPRGKDRTAIGHEAIRIAARVMLLCDVFGLKPDHPKIVRLVNDFADALDRCPPRLEVGLTWPWIIVASQATVSIQPRLQSFITRARWKGSAMPSIADSIVNNIWQGHRINQARHWRDVIREMGCPLVL